MADLNPRTIGGSDIATILGLSSWQTPHQLWARVTGRAPGLPENPSMAEGKQMEPLILREYAEDTGAVLERIPTQYDPHKPWRRYSPDAIATLPDGSKRVVEAKWAARGLSELPAAYWLQVQWYMHHLQLEVADVVVREPGRRSYILATVPYDAATMAEVCAIVDDWYHKHVVQDVEPPPATAEERYQWALARVKKQGVILQPDATLDLAVRRLLKAKEAIKHLQARIRDYETKLLEVMLDHGATKVQSASGWTATLVERKGQVKWQAVAEALGAKEHPELVEKYRGKPLRYLRFSIKKPKEVENGRPEGIAAAGNGLALPAPEEQGTNQGSPAQPLDTREDNPPGTDRAEAESQAG